MDIVISLFKLFIICWVFKDLFEFIGGFISEIEIKGRWLGITKYLISYVMMCHKCSSMWFSFILTGDIFLSALVALSINYLSEVEYKYKSKTEL